jgi:hypothetical protein
MIAEEGMISSAEKRCVVLLAETEDRSTNVIREMQEFSVPLPSARGQTPVPVARWRCRRKTAAPYRTACGNFISLTNSFRQCAVTNSQYKRTISYVHLNVKTLFERLPYC